MGEEGLKKQIIDEAINSLKAEGLRFSVDALAKRLKISKKTIYKYFPTKEELAIAVYDEYYNRCNVELGKVEKRKSSALASSLLGLYHTSFCMSNDDIFNKYALNESIRENVKARHNVLWSKICEILELEKPLLIKTIIDGTFKELQGILIPLEEVIDKIKVIIW